jgi:hypothetical protein
MAQLRLAVGTTGSYLLTARDDARLLAQMTLAEQNGAGWSWS